MPRCSPLLQRRVSPALRWRNAGEGRAASLGDLDGDREVRNYICITSVYTL